MRRFFLGLLWVGAVSPAMASFELLLVADNGLGTLATRKVHRFEARTGTYLGSFGGFSGNILGSWVRKSTNSFFVQDTTGVTEWDYNTGALKGSFVGTVNFRMVVRPDGAVAAIFDGLNDFLTASYPTVSFIGGSSIVLSAIFREGLWYGQNDVMAFDINNRVFRRFAMNAAGTAGTLNGTSTNLATASFGQMARNGGTNRLVMASGADVKWVDTNLLNTFSFTSPFASSRTAAAAHNGYFIGGTNGTVGLISYLDSRDILRAQFGSGVLIDPVSMETVLAPEPGTMVAMGLGVAALLRRRRRKA